MTRPSKGRPRLIPLRVLLHRAGSDTKTCFHTMESKQHPPKLTRARTPSGTLTLASLMACSAPLLLAQATETVPVDTKPEEKKEEVVIELSPFEVNSSKDQGYAATSSLAGSRLNTELRDVAAAVQVVTPEFMKDVGANNLQKVLVYTTSTEVAGIGGNFYGGDAYSKGYAQRVLNEPQKTARIRGLNDADISRDFFPTDVPMDWYNMSRMDISRGPNSVLFGLGSPAGLINNTLKTPTMSKSTYTGEVQTGSYGSFRQMLDLDQQLLPNQLAVRVVGVNDKARFRQKGTWNHDKRVYAAIRATPRISEKIYTQIDVQLESGRIDGNRPMAGTPSDFISNWFGPANRLSIPNDEYWTAPGFVEDLYASQTIGGQLWDNHPATFFEDPNSATIGLTGLPTQAMLLRGNHNVNGGGWGSWVGLLNPNNVGSALNPKNTKAYYANNPTVSAAIAEYEAATGKTFRGFGQGLWPTQMIVDGPLADLMRNENIVGPNKSEYNNFDVSNLQLTQSFFRGRLGYNFAYNRQSYRYGYTNLMEGLWGINMISVDVNETLRGSDIPNPNYGRPFTIGEGRGSINTRKRENYRATGYGVVKGSDFFKQDSLASTLIGEHTFTGVYSSQHYENSEKYYALYRWKPEYLLAVDKWNGYATWRGLHYLGGSLLNTPSMDAITGVSGVHTYQAPSLTQTVWHDAQGTWTNANFSLLSSATDLNKLYDGASAGYDNTKSKVFVWQGKMLGNVVVPIFGWRRDTYERWNKPSNVPKDTIFGYVLPDSPEWNYDKVKRVYADEQRRSWSIAVHGKELMELIGHPLPRGTDLTVMYNDSSSFRPSDVSASIYNKQEPTPSGQTKDVSVMLTTLDNRVTFRVTKYKTEQKNTPYSGPQPDFGWAKANLSRSMDGMMWEIGAWAGSDAKSRVQPTPEWLVNKWMFGTSYDQTVANTPLPTNWQSDPNILNQPLRIRRSAVPGSATYVSQGMINPDTGLAYIAPPLDDDEIAYRTAWFKARSDAEWSRPVDQEFWSAMGYARDYTATWGGFWEPNAWVRPNNLRSLNDLTSKGTEYELTANPTPNWRITLNASKAEAVRSNVLDSWDAYIKANEAFYFDGGYAVGDAPASDYWSFKGYYDIVHTPGTTISNGGRLGTEFNNSVYNPYFQAKATAEKAVNELRKWHWNVVTNYRFSRGLLKNVGIGGAVRWQDRATLGYYPKFDVKANSWVIDLDKPIKGDSEINYDAWISYERKLGRKINWSVQLNVNDLFAKSSMIPIQANPDGTIAQVRIPAQTTWQLRNTFTF